MNTTDKLSTMSQSNLRIRLLSALITKRITNKPNELLTKFNDVLASDSALKDLFDEASKKLEEGK